METVRTFVRYVNAAGTDAFDDVRLFSYYAQLANAGKYSDGFLDITIKLYSALTFAKGNTPIDEYEEKADVSMDEAVEVIGKAFQSIYDDTDTKPMVTSNKVVLEQPEFDIENKAQMRIEKYRAHKKNNATFMLLHNALQVGADIASLYDMEYETARNFIEYRVKLLNEENKKKGRR